MDDRNSLQKRRGVSGPSDNRDDDHSPDPLMFITYRDGQPGVPKSHWFFPFDLQSWGAKTYLKADVILVVHFVPRDVTPTHLSGVLIFEKLYRDGRTTWNDLCENPERLQVFRKSKAGISMRFAEENQ